jgi:muramoyltetrapeptide carboxypeptidase
MGFSDITSLLIAINKKTGVETFHGPMAIQPWPEFTVTYLKAVLFDGSEVTFENPQIPPDPKVDIIQTKNRITTLTGGIASGPLIGGNLSVLVSLMGTEYEPDWQGRILFVEDIGENNYKIDRLLSQLELAGVFEKINGFIFGECTDCKVAKKSYGSKNLRQILRHYTNASKVPAFMGAMIGHEPLNLTLPEGLVVEINADAGTIKLLESAVIK